jgi:hypothetical protein
MKFQNDAAPNTQRLAIRGMAYDLTAEEIAAVSGGSELGPGIPPNETTTDINGDHTNDDTDT